MVPRDAVGGNASTGLDVSNIGSVPTSPTFTDLLHDATLLSYEHLLRLQDVIGEGDWNVDLFAPEFRFTGERDIVCTGVHLLGSAAPGPRSWLWAWANPTGYPESVTGLSLAVRQFGQEHGIRELSEPEVAFDALPGSPDDPALVSMLMIRVVSVLSGRWTPGSVDAGGGTQAALILEHPEFVLPDPDVARFMRVLQQGLNEPYLDKRRAYSAYAERRGLEVSVDPGGSRMEMAAPDFQVVVDFDELGRPAQLSAQTRSATS